MSQETILRGHHLLCVHGFRGMGYSPAFIAKMTTIVEDIRNDAIDFTIQTVAAFDDACMCCPHRGETECVASEGSNDHVLSMDERVMTHLGLQKEQTYQKSFLVALTAAKVKPDDLDVLCAGCSWLAYGVCKEGISELRNKHQTGR